MRARIAAALLLAVLVCARAGAEGGESGTGRRLYLLPPPTESTVEVGPVSRTAAAVTMWGSSLVKGTGFLLATGVPYHLALAAFWYAADVVRVAPYIAGWHATDLWVRQARRNSQLLSSLERVAAPKRITLLSGTDYELNGIIPTKQTSRGVLFIETDRELTKEMLDQVPHPSPEGKWGTPIEIKDPKLTKVTLQLTVDGKTEPVKWTMTLDELLSNKPLPPEVAAAWRKPVKAAYAQTPGILRLWLNATLPRRWTGAKQLPPDHIRIDAMVEDPGAGYVNLGTVALGSRARQLLGVGLLAKILNWTRLSPKGRIPVSQREPAPPGHGSCGVDFENLALVR